MRITNSILLRGYNRDLSRLRNAKNDCEKKITSTRKFSRASEAPLSAAKALNVRKSQYYSKQYKENLGVAAKFYTEAETSLLQVSEKMAEIRETIIAAVNTTKDNVDYRIYAQQLETRAQELCAIFNTDSAGRAIFGGESDNGMPFTIIDDSEGRPGTVLYHGVPVNAMNDYKGYPYSNDVYMDIGLGMVTDQKEHTQDPMSMLNISFNGTKISGCGAQYGVADIDLTSVQDGRSYIIDVYADGRQQTISFRGQATQKENIKLINEKLAEAYRKDKSYGKTTPVMDDQGIVYLVDKDGKPVDNGIACVVNNTTCADESRAEKLVVDNDSNYTNKFRINLRNLAEETRYYMEVDVDGETKEISFMTGADDFFDPANPIYREDASLENLQKALDEAFGEGKVNVTTHAPNKGVVSSEGHTVKLSEVQPTGKKNSGAVISEKTIGTLDLKAMKYDGTKYTIKAEINGTVYERELTTENSVYRTQWNFETLFDDLGRCWFDPDSGVCKIGESPINILQSDAENAAPIKKDYTVSVIEPDSLKNGQEYEFKVIVENSIGTIKFKGGPDRETTLQNMKAALDDEFQTSDILVGPDGEIATERGFKVQVVNNSSSASTKPFFERERVYSNNYIQLTLDAARALRNNDIEYANGCIDRIVTANEKLLVQIADLGCNEDFIDFNVERITTREENLAERQNDLETTDPEYQITLWKQYEAYYNACLQMSSSVIPNSIFNYMK